MQDEIVISVRDLRKKFKVYSDTTKKLSNIFTKELVT